jgi:hypothetical protein
LQERGIGRDAVALREYNKIPSHDFPPRNASALAVADDQRAGAGEITQCLQNMLGTRLLHDRDENRGHAEDEQDDRFLKIAEREINDTTTEKKHQHRFAHDFQNNAKGRTPVGAWQLVKTFAFEPVLRLVLAETDPGAGS